MDYGSYVAVKRNVAVRAVEKLSRSKIKGRKYKAREL
jgi:hypothetical protein